MEVINCVKDGLNSNSGAIIAIATIALVGVTIYYAWVTHQMRRDGQKPRIAIYLGFEKEQRIEGNPIKVPTMYLYVENIGLGPAYDVEFDPDPDFIIPGGGTLREIQFIARNILYLPPGQKRKLLIAHHWTEVHARTRLWEERLEIRVTYRGIRHKEYDGCFCLNFGEYKSEYEEMRPEYPVQINV